MKLRFELPRRARWAVPAGAVALVAVVGTASAITVVQAAPALPARTPAELLATVAGETGPPPALTGTVVETASLGIPQLPGAADPTSIASLLTGSHTIKIWYADPSHIRVAVPVTLGESDLIRNGSTAWIWQSNNNTATHLQIPATLPGMREHAPKPPLTPQQAAKQILAAVGPTTVVSTQTNVSVAGQAAYQLVLAPKDSRSLVGKVTIAVDGQHPGVPLRLQVFARGASAPSFSVGYTSISFVRPAAANFDFTPPAGAHVHNVRGPGHWYADAPLSGQKLVPPMRGSWSGQAPGGAHWRANLPSKSHLGKLRHPGHTNWSIRGNPPPDPFQAMGPQVIGTGWLSVAVLPQAVLGGLAGQGSAASAAGQAAASVGGAGGGPVDGGAVLGALLKSAQPVHGSWGSGKLLRTSLFSILITNNHVLIGAVDPSVLYTAAAKVK
jgi:outer membrane lipoprotein-sorting protein